MKLTPGTHNWMLHQLFNALQDQSPDEMLTVNDVMRHIDRQSMGFDPERVKTELIEFRRQGIARAEGKSTDIPGILIEMSLDCWSLRKIDDIGDGDNMRRLINCDLFQMTGPINAHGDLAWVDEEGLISNRGATPGVMASWQGDGPPLIGNILITGKVLYGGSDDERFAPVKVKRSELWRMITPVVAIIKGAHQ